VDVDKKLDRIIADLRSVLDLDYTVRRLDSTVRELITEVKFLKSRFSDLGELKRILKNAVIEIEKYGKISGELRGLGEKLDGISDGLGDIELKLMNLESDIAGAGIDDDDDDITGDIVEEIDDDAGGDDYGELLRKFLNGS